MTNEQRCEFEEWFGNRRGQGMLGKTPNGGYEWVATSDAAEVWQAATLKATEFERERCALVSEDCGAIHIAKRIRASVLPPPPTGTATQPQGGE